MSHSRSAVVTDPDAESAFAPIPSWTPMTFPRRGGFGTDVAPVDPAAGTDLSRSIEANDELLHHASWELVNDPDPNALVAAARRYRDGEVSSLGAAALCRLLTRFVEPNRGADFVDGWVARHGPAFAVAAVLETADMQWVQQRVPVPENATDMYIETCIGDGPPEDDFRLPRFMLTEQLGQIDDPQRQVSYTVLEPMLTRMRALLAVASDADHSAAREAAAPLRTNAVRRFAASFMFPTERRWSAEAILGVEAVPYHWRTHAMVSSNTPAELERALSGDGCRRWLADEAIVAAIVEGLGADVTSVLTTAFDTEFPYRSAQDDVLRLRILHALASIPTDEAFTALLERAHVKNGASAVQHASRHFPRRAFRILAQSDSNLFDRHVREHSDLAAELAETLPAAAQRRIERLTTTLPEATDLPALLVRPPWSNRKAPAPATVIDGLTAPTIRRIDWLPGELEELRNTPHGYSYTTWDQYRQYIRETSAQVVNEWEAWVIFLLAPDEVARPLLTDWAGTSIKDPLRIVARYQLDALPLMLQFARARPGAAAPYLMPYVDIDVARLHATMFATRKNLRKPALAWLLRHAADAVTLLVPDAVGPVGAQRDHATAALRALARATSRETVVRGAAQYGDAAMTTAATLVDLDPLEMLPKRIPRIPAWADVASLPPILTEDRDAALPASAVDVILTMCAVGTADAPYAGLDTVTAFCDRTSLAAAMWELFNRWWGAGAPSKDNWVVLAQGRLGDDSTVARLAPLVRRWPGEGGAARAQLGLDALAANGSARALTELDRISRKMKFKSLKSGAAERVEEVAERLGLDREQLADRTAPDLDLAPDGTMTFDYGARKFTVGFTEALVPFVLDEAGKKSTGLPEATAQDDPALVDDAKKRFTAFKREAKAVATEQVKRFNRALVTGRRWDGGEFAEYIMGHPLLIHIARRLLWASFDEQSRPAVVFRVTEDGSLEDLNGDTLTLPDGPIGLVHPAHIPESAAAWADVFAEHRILQPFPQLERPVHHPLPGDVDGSGLSRFTGVTATPSQALRLTYRGWEPVWENPASWGQGLAYRLDNTVSVLLGLDPGMGTGSPYEGYPDQTLVSVTLRGGTLNDVDRATVSELIADLAGFAS
ncbi:hypothetical protein M2284_002969 [Rhodococcus sp. LBL1]|nr:hypothetical protein [Rhodococcus sp. LBL1]MDH6684366.1 hypothetical protein [Rhodococcus sp. LBL2]